MIGILGGLDFILVFFVIVKIFEFLNLDKKNIVIIIMFGFGIIDRIYNNVLDLCREFGIDFREINIVKVFF